MKLVRASKPEKDDEAMFRLPLAEFTGARNALAARLKKSGREEEKAAAARVKALAKPSISAWAVNQLYWNHREAFDQLIASGERFHKAQTSRSAGKVADIRAALDARRECLSQLSDIAARVLRDAGHNPAPDTIHRITTTLEGISAYASRSNAPRPGRLTADVDPPGFELFGSSSPGAGMTQPTEKPSRVTPSQKSSSAPTNTRRKMSPDDEVRQLAEVRKAKMAAAKVSLQDAKRSLTEARSKAQSLEAAQKRADTEAKKAEKHRREAEETLEKAEAASKDAARRARKVAVEVKEAAGAVEEALREVEEASHGLEKLFGE
jgi:DNA-binding transcriptional MerR regulator